MPLRLLIADDERLFRQSLRTLLETAKDIAVVAEAADGREAVVKAKQTQPDMALLDVRMPKMDGIKAAKLISAVAPRTKILMLSIHDDDEKIVSAIKAGARGYILKDTDRADFIEIIRYTHAGKSHSSPYLAHLTLDETWRLDDSSREERERRFLDKYGLSDLELKVLHLVAEGLNNEEISRLTHVARETVKGQLKGLFRKLQVKNRTEAAVLAVREGID
jgi:two-component system, NarL family, response regulator LiaR